MVNVLFFFSGFSGLVYEVVWSRMLVLVMGNTTMAISTILAVFMGGMAGGSYYWGRWIERHPISGFRVFGRMEVGIGVYALVFPVLIHIVSPLERWFASAAFAGHADLAQLLPRFIICCALLTLPTFLMGGTFSVIGHYLIRSRESFHRDISLLYGINTAGAVLGALLTGFFLIHLLGHRNSLWLAALISIAVGTIALGTGEKTTLPSHRVGKRQKSVKLDRAPFPSRLNALVMVGLLVSGFCAMAYQVLWTRLLVLVADNSIYSFTSILVMFLAGIAFGSLLLTTLIGRIRKPALFFGGIQVAIAATAFCYPYFIEPRPVDPATPYWRFLIARLPILLCIPTMLMGMTFPLAAHIHQLTRKTIGASIGTVLAINTTGAVAGAVAAGFWLIPALGFRNGLMLLFAANLIMGGIILASSLRGLAMELALLLIAGAGLAGHIYMPTDYFKNKYARIEPESQLIYYNEGKAANVTIFQRPDGNRVLYINGIPEVDTTYLSVRTLKLLGVLAGIMSQPPSEALMVTFGAGITAGATALFADRVDCVDLAQQARTIAGYFGPVNGQVAANPKVKIHVDDARHYLQASDKRYAIIVSDATHPRAHDSWVLFTREFYKLVRNRLTNEGVFCQWLPLHGMDGKQFISIIRTFASVFPHTSLWREAEAYIVLLATPTPFTLDFAGMTAKLSEPEVFQTLRSVDLNTPIDLLDSFSMGPSQLTRLTEKGAIIEDNAPAHLFFSFRSTLAEQYRVWPRSNYRLLKRYEESALPYITNISADPKRQDAIINRIRRMEQLKKRQF